MILLSGGDSFTYGNELSDDHPDRPSSKTWAANLANHFEFDHECVAMPGAGNGFVSQALIVKANQLLKENKKFVVAVMWTYTGRISLKVNDQWFQLTDFVLLDSADEFRAKWPQIGEKYLKKIIERLETARATGYLNLMRDYMKFTVLSGDYAIIRSYQSIYLTAQYLKQHNIPFFFVNAVDQAVGITHEHTLPDVAPYFDSLESADWISVPSFCTWAKENNYKIGTGQHPLDQAHTDYAKLILQTGLVETKWQLK